MQNLMNKIMETEHELLKEIESAKKPMDMMRLIEMYNELCEFKVNIMKSKTDMPKTGNPY